MVRAGWLAVCLAACAAPATPPAPLPPPSPAAVPAPPPDAPSERPTLASLCRDQLTRFAATLPGAAAITVVTPRDDAAVADWTTRAMAPLDAFAALFDGKLHVSRRDGGPGSPQALMSAVSDKRCGDAGTEGHACVELSYRGASGLSLMTPDQPVDDFTPPLATILAALRAQVEGSGPRFGLVRRPGTSFTDLDLTPRSNSPGGHHMRERLALTFPSLEIVDVRIEGQPIDPTLDGLIVLQSATDWSRGDLERIDELMMRGDKALFVFAGAANLAPHDTGMTITLDAHGIAPLLEGYGLALEPGLILDAPIAFDVQHAGVPRPPPARRVGPGTSLLRVAPGFAALAQVPRVVAHFASPLRLQPERQPGAWLRPLLFTSPQAVVVDHPISALPVPAWEPPAGAAAERVVGATVAGELRSAFDPSRRARGLVVAVSSPVFFANPYARAGNPAGPEHRGDEALLLAGWGYASQWHWPDLFLALMLDWAAKPLRACEEQWAG